MSEFNFLETYPALKAILWVFYPFATLIVIDLMSSIFDDDDDQGGGMMIPAYNTSRN
tara:strand:- start:424 stop:594 length:171 start_codon:yes stop_codon:yes gene_type:complete